MFKKVPGTKDILPDQTGLWQEIEGTSRKIFSIYNYSEIRTPFIEETALFNRSLGESTEIVQKQMFIIKRDEDSYALRPEGTASIVRAYVENSLDKTKGFVKFYYMGPMFRAERPQKGRLRQFNQIGCEAIGSYGPDIDVEVISLADALLKKYGIKDYTIALNTLGCGQDKKALNDFLRASLKDKLGGLCDDCKDRYDRNILRILDCKNEACRNIVSDLRIGHEHLCPDCKAHFDYVKQGLDILKVNYKITPNLVRGLDYYNRTVFEIKHGGLGPQQDALGAGGRYDGLVKELGGPDAGAIGFSFGFERLLLALENAAAAIPAKGAEKLIYVIPLGEAARKQSQVILSDLRDNASIPADTSVNYGGSSLKSAMRKADDLGAAFVIIIGDDEIRENCVTLKDMANKTQEKVPMGQLKEKLRIDQQKEN
jgi:histidyl-tRNA synthetase